MILDQEALYRLMCWLSPAYPVGGFSYSHGLEAAVENGLVHDRASLQDWIAMVVEQGTGLMDTALLCAAWRAPSIEALDDIAELAAALKGTAELSLEATQQGAAFLSTTARVWPSPALAALAARRQGLPVCYAMAFGAACRERVPLEAAAMAYLQAFAANLVSAGVRLVPLGQTDGQVALAALAEPVARGTARALALPLEEIGIATPMVDILSMQHETQYTRLFRS